MDIKGGIILKREELVKRLVVQKFNWVIGGYENAITDGHQNEMPPDEDLKSEIYDEVMSSKTLQVGAYLMEVQKDIRFLGKKRILEMIETVYNKRIGGANNET